MKFNPNLEEIKVYEGGKPIELVIREYGIKPEDIVKLASNENPFGVSKKVKPRSKKPLKRFLCILMIVCLHSKMSYLKNIKLQMKILLLVQEVIK